MSRIRELTQTPETSAPLRRRRWGRILLKSAVTAGIFALLLNRIELADVWSAVQQARLPWLALAFAACSIGFITSSLKWRDLLSGLGVCAPRFQLLKVYAIGHFAGSFLPGTIGGDVVRGRLSGPLTGGYFNAAASILMERLTGLIMMVSLAALAILWDPSRLMTAPVLTLIASSLVAVIVGLSVAGNRRLANSLMLRLRHGRLRRPLRLLYRLHRVLRDFPVAPLVRAFGWSILFYSGSGLVLWCCARAIGADLSWIEATSVSVVVCVLMLVPVSIGGFGLRQAGDVYMMGLLGVDPALALVISLLRQLVSYSYTLVGGLLFLSWTPPEPTVQPAPHRASATAVPGDEV